MKNFKGTESNKHFMKLYWFISIKLYIFVVITSILSFVIMPASSIQCYSCESVSDTNCGENFSMEEHFKIDCDQVAPPRYLSHDFDYLNATACMKKIYKGKNINLTYMRKVQLPGLNCQH
ncbi:UPAR/Ly6 domain-containing protein CG9338-like isoform 2-T2 [Cochliomyia hominivorax]